MGSSNNTNEASLTGLQLTSCCGGLDLIDQGLVLVLTHCAGIVDSCSEPNSETFCRKNHPASSLFLNKSISLKLGEKQLFSPKGEQASETYDYILSINCEKTFPFWESGKFAHGLDIKCSFYWEQKSIFFHILSFYHEYLLCTFCEMFVLSLKYFRKNE